MFVTTNCIMITHIIFVLLAASFNMCSSSPHLHQPEQGIFNLHLTQENLDYASKVLYNQSKITIKALTSSTACVLKDKIDLEWLVIGTTCKGELSASSDELLKQCFTTPEICAGGYSIKYIRDRNVIKCGEVFHIDTSKDWTVFVTESNNTLPTVPKPSSRKRRAKEVKGTTPTQSTTAKAPTNNQKGSIIVDFMGEFIVMLQLKGKNPENTLEVEVRMKSEKGYLSAHEYPLLTFYMIMCILYVLYAVAWLVMSACNYHDLLWVQFFWIGGVILLGLIEKAVYYSEYLNVNTSGVSEMGVAKFAAVVSACKRAVARMLVIIVSLGFGIVKPRLGPTLHKVIGIGLLFFVVAAFEEIMRLDTYVHPSSRSAWMISYLPLSVIDAVICWWVFMSLLQTMKTLRLRRNTTKLSLYRHFANTIILCIVISVGIMIWDVYFREQGCRTDLSNDWFKTACWPMLFSFILLVIMVLWRPNANNQRYAYSPMIDGNDSDDDETGEPMLGSGATENMKMRGAKKTKYVKSDVDKAEEDLKWIEENIPQTVADAALPALLDSDEEVMTTKYEMSKME